MLWFLVIACCAAAAGISMRGEGGKEGEVRGPREKGNGVMNEEVRKGTRI